MGSYVPSTRAERQEMLEAIGLKSYQELYCDVPEQMQLDRPLEIPAGMSELEVRRTMESMAAKNRVFSTVLRGAGSYDHYIPSIVKYIPAKEEFLTAYTPYQAEISQGVLQSIFEGRRRGAAPRGGALGGGGAGPLPPPKPPPCAATGSAGSRWCPPPPIRT